MYHKLTVYVKSRYQTNLFPSCCFGDKYHKYHGNLINTLQISFIFYTLCITTCFRDARHGFNIYSILCPLGEQLVLWNKVAKISCFYKFRKKSGRAFMYMHILNKMLCGAT